MKQKIIQLKNIQKTYQIGDTTVHAIKDVSLDITEGDFIAIIGPSGSGKSTLMYLLGILDIPTQGNVIVNGKDITKMSESDLATIRGKTIGFIFQQFNLMPQLTALENVMLPMMFQRGTDEKRAKELLKLVGLGERMDHKPTQLSGGQQQRVAIARSLTNDPQILLCDEPTGNLDSVTGKQIMEMLTDLHEKHGKTIILVTHDNSLILHAKTVVFLKDGLILKIKRNR